MLILTVETLSLPRSAAAPFDAGVSLSVRLRCSLPGWHRLSYRIPVAGREIPDRIDGREGVAANADDGLLPVLLDEYA